LDGQVAQGHVVTDVTDVTVVISVTSDSRPDEITIVGGG
jgi:hypothetical protein